MWGAGTPAALRAASVKGRGMRRNSFVIRLKLVPFVLRISTRGFVSSLAPMPREGEDRSLPRELHVPCGRVPWPPRSERSAKSCSTGRLRRRGTRPGAPLWGTSTMHARVRRDARIPSIGWELCGSKAPASGATRASVDRCASRARRAGEILNCQGSITVAALERGSRGEGGRRGPRRAS